MDRVPPAKCTGLSVAPGSYLPSMRCTMPWALTRPRAPQRLQMRSAGSTLVGAVALRGMSVGVISRQVCPRRDGGHWLCGISGCSIWQAYYPGCSIAGWHVDDAVIVAVQTGTYGKGTIVKGTYWGVVNHIINKLLLHQCHRCISSANRILHRFEYKIKYQRNEHNNQREIHPLEYFI